MTAATVARPARARLHDTPSGPPGVLCVHGFTFAGPSPDPRPGSACERPGRLACTRCGLVVVVDCHSTRTLTCTPCGTIYRHNVRRIAHVRRGSILLVTLTAPGLPGHKRNVGGERVRALGKDGKRHTSWRGGRWEDCDCWRSALHSCGDTCDDGCTTQDFAAWNASAASLYNRLWNNGVRRADGSTVLTGPYAGTVREDLSWLHGAYFRATEAQARGALHYHLIVRVNGSREVLQGMIDRLADMAESFGFGHVLDVEVIPAEDAARAAGYVAKYVSKGSNDRPEVPWRKVKTRRLSVDCPPSPEYALRNGWVVEGPRDTWLAWESTRATYRTWSASRDWPATMAALRAAQAHFAAVLAVLPDWQDPDGLPADIAAAVPDRPDLPVPWPLVHAFLWLSAALVLL